MGPWSTGLGGWFHHIPDRVPLWCLVCFGEERLNGELRRIGECRSRDSTEVGRGIHSTYNRLLRTYHRLSGRGMGHDEHFAVASCEIAPTKSERTN